MAYYRNRGQQVRAYTSSGMGFGGWLTLLFIGLKLTGHITWPWIWVLSPIWISILLVIGLLLLFIALYLVVEKFK